MKQRVDTIITLPVKAIFKAVYFYFMFHKKKLCWLSERLSRFF